MNSGIHSILNNAVYLILAKLLTSAARIIYAILLAKLLGAELYGAFNYGLSWYILLVPVSVLGLDAILLREIGRDKLQKSELIGMSLSLRLVATLLVASLSIVFAWLIETDPLIRQLLFIFTLALIGRGFSLWSNAIFTGYESSKYVLIQEGVFRLFEVIVGVVLLFNGYGLIAVASVHAVGWLLQGLTGHYLVKRYLVDIRFIWHWEKQLALLKLGFPFILSAFFSGWLLQGPLVMYRFYGGISTDLGQLALALQALFILGAIVGELGTAALPVLARSVDRADGKGGLYLDITLKAGFFMASLLGVAGITIGPWLISFLFGEGFSQTAILLPWTLIMVGIYFCIRSTNSLLVANGQYVKLLVINIVGASVMTGSFILLTEYYGEIGALFALGLGLISVLSGNVYILKKVYKLKFFTLFLKVNLSLLIILYVTVNIQHIDIILEFISEILKWLH